MRLIYLTKVFKPLLLLGLLFSVLMVSGQNQDRVLQEIQKFQSDLNAEFKDPEQTILKQEDQADFEGLAFYPIDLSFRVTAQIERIAEAVPFLMPTTTERKPEYVLYGILHFVIQGQDLSLPIYQNTEGLEDLEYADYLFLPFTDWTSGDGSYGGGRYIDLAIPDGDKMALDFNQSYNPYCAYNERYSCPIPPKENDLPIRIEAGVKAYKH